MLENAIDINQLPNVRRFENFSKDEMNAHCMELTHAVYPHEEMFGRYCTLEEHIDCPPDGVFRYLADAENLAEWTYSMREFAPTSTPGTLVSYDKVGGGNTKIYTRVVANAAAMTVDYHCAWDQGDKLWMIYLMRVVPAELVLNKPGSVVLWTNCHHPFYDKNPRPRGGARGAEGVGGRSLALLLRRAPRRDAEPQEHPRAPRTRTACPSPPVRCRDEPAHQPDRHGELPARETSSNARFFSGAKGSGMFRGPNERRHVAEGETAVDMIERATSTLCDRLSLTPRRDVDILLTNVSCLDVPFTGCGASVSKRIGASPKWIFDVQNSGCVSFVYMMELARALMASSGARTALIANVQNAAGRVFRHPDNRARPQSSVPGDACGVGYLVANDESPVRSIVSHAYGEYADDMRVKSDDGNAWWAPRSTPLYIDFTEERVAAVVARGNALVPAVVREACQAAEIGAGDIDLLVTNQPNLVFLRNWREALLLPKEKHVDTFEEHGNTFGAAIPVSLERAVATGRLGKGDHVVLGGFSHAGDYAAAAVVHWQAPRDGAASGPKPRAPADPS